MFCGVSADPYFGSATAAYPASVPPCPAERATLTPQNAPKRSTPGSAGAPTPQFVRRVKRQGARGIARIGYTPRNDVPDQRGRAYVLNPLFTSPFYRRRAFCLYIYKFSLFLSFNSQISRSCAKRTAHREARLVRPTGGFRLGGVG